MSKFLWLQAPSRGFLQCQCCLYTILLQCGFVHRPIRTWMNQKSFIRGRQTLEDILHLRESVSVNSIVHKGIVDDSGSYDLCGLVYLAWLERCVIFGKLSWLEWCVFIVFRCLWLERSGLTQCLIEVIELVELRCCKHTRHECTEEDDWKFHFSALLWFDWTWGIRRIEWLWKPAKPCFYPSRIRQSGRSRRAREKVLDNKYHMMRHFFWQIPFTKAWRKNSVIIRMITNKNNQIKSAWHSGGGKAGSSFLIKNRNPHKFDL